MTKSKKFEDDNVSTNNNETTNNDSKQPRRKQVGKQASKHARVVSFEQVIIGLSGKRSAGWKSRLFGVRLSSVRGMDSSRNVCV